MRCAEIILAAAVAGLALLPGGQGATSCTVATAGGLQRAADVIADSAPSLEWTSSCRLSAPHEAYTRRIVVSEVSPANATVWDSGAVVDSAMPDWRFNQSLGRLEPAASAVVYAGAPLRPSTSYVFTVCEEWGGHGGRENASSSCCSPATFKTDAAITGAKDDARAVLWSRAMERLLNSTLDSLVDRVEPVGFAPTSGPQEAGGPQKGMDEHES